MLRGHLSQTVTHSLHSLSWRVKMASSPSPADASSPVPDPDHQEASAGEEEEEEVQEDHDTSGEQGQLTAAPPATRPTTAACGFLTPAMFGMKDPEETDDAGHEDLTRLELLVPEDRYEEIRAGLDRFYTYGREIIGEEEVEKLRALLRECELEHLLPEEDEAEEEQGDGDAGPREPGVDLVASLRHRHVFSMASQGNVYSLSVVPSERGSGEKLVCASLSKPIVSMEMLDPAGFRSSSRVLSGSYRRLPETDPAGLLPAAAVPSMSDIPFMYLPADNMEIASLDAFVKAHSAPELVVGVAYHKLKDTFPPDPETLGAALQIYGSDLGEGLPDPFSVGMVPHQPTDVDPLDLHSLAIRGWRATIELDFAPYHLTHADIPIWNHQMRDFCERVFLLGGGDCRVHMYVEDSRRNSWVELKEIERHFPELAGEFRSIPTWVEVRYLDPGNCRRVTVVGTEDGLLYASLVHVVREEPTVVRRWDAFLYGRGRVTGAALFNLDVPAAAAGVPEGAGRRLPRRHGLSNRYERYDLDSNSDLPELSLVVAAALGPAVVYRDILNRGLGCAKDLPESDGFDVITCCLALDADLDGRNELAIGTFGGVVLIYKHDGRSWTLSWQHELRHPVHSLASADLTGDGVLELCALASRGVHVFQHEIPLVRELRLRRLRKLLEIREREDAEQRERGEIF